MSYDNILTPEQIAYGSLALQAVQSSSLMPLDMMWRNNDGRGVSIINMITQKVEASISKDYAKASISPTQLSVTEVSMTPSIIDIAMRFTDSQQRHTNYDYNASLLSAEGKAMGRGMDKIICDLLAAATYANTVGSNEGDINQGLNSQKLNLAATYTAQYTGNNFSQNRIIIGNVEVTQNAAVYDTTLANSFFNPYSPGSAAKFAQPIIKVGDIAAVGMPSKMINSFPITPIVGGDQTTVFYIADGAGMIQVYKEPTPLITRGTDGFYTNVMMQAEMSFNVLFNELIVPIICSYGVGFKPLPIAPIFLI